MRERSRSIRRSARSGQLCGLLIIVAVLFTAVASGCSLQTYAVGDSITNQSRDEIAAQFAAAGWDQGVVAIDSQRIGQMRPFIQAVVAESPDLNRMFINLGTNDAIDIQNGEYGLQSAKNELHAAVHDVINKRPRACVFLVTVKVLPSSYSTYRYAANELRQEMKAIDDAFPKVHLIDWDYLTKPHDGEPGEDQWFNTWLNIPHLNQAGQNALADEYRFFGSKVNDCGF